MTEQTFTIGPRPVQSERALPTIEGAVLAISQGLKDLEENPSGDFERRSAVLMDRLVTDLEDKRRESESARDILMEDDVDFTTRRDFELRRAKGIVRPTTRADGKSFDVRGRDGHARAGRTMGWSEQAINTVVAYFKKRLFLDNVRPFEVHAMGNREENGRAVNIFNLVVDHLFDIADFPGQVFDAWARTVATHGTGEIRYEMGGGTEMRQTERGWEEVVTRIKPTITAWRYGDIIYTDAQEKDINKQDGIYIITPSMTVADLSMNELIIGKSGNVTGKFRNLDILRKRQIDDAKNSPSTSQRQKVTDKNRFTLVEYEGSIPWLTYQKEGLLDFDILNLFGVNVPLLDVPYPAPIPDPDNPEDMEAWARTLERIRVWNVAYVSDSSEGTTTEEFTGEFLLRLEPPRTKTQRKSIYDAVYIPELNSRYGRGIPITGKDLEESGDSLMNDQDVTSERLARRPIAVNPSMLEKGSLEPLLKAKDNPDGVYIMQTGAAGKGVKLSDLIEPFPVDFNPNAERQIEHRKREFENVTLVSAAIKGTTGAATDTATLGERELNELSSAIMLDEVAMGMGNQTARLAGDMFSDFVTFHGPAGFMREASRITGIAISEIERVFPSMDSFVDDLLIEHPLASARDQDALANTLSQIHQLTTGAVWAPQDLAQRILEAKGVQNAEQIVFGNKMKPEDEEDQLSRGNYIRPKVDEDIPGHLVFHMNTFQQMNAAIEQAGGIENMPEEFTLWYGLELQHIQDTLDLAGIAFDISAGQSLSAQAPGVGSQPKTANTDNRLKRDRNIGQTDQAAQQNGGNATLPGFNQSANSAASPIQSEAIGT